MTKEKDLNELLKYLDNPDDMKNAECDISDFAYYFVNILLAADDELINNITQSFLKFNKEIDLSVNIRNEVDKRLIIYGELRMLSNIFYYLSHTLYKDIKLKNDKKIKTRIIKWVKKIFKKKQRR